MMESMKRQIENTDNTWDDANLALMGILEKGHARGADKKYSILFWPSRQIKACSWCCPGRIFNGFCDLAPYPLPDSRPRALSLPLSPGLSLTGLLAKPGTKQAHTYPGASAFAPSLQCFLLGLLSLEFPSNLPLSVRTSLMEAHRRLLRE